MVPLAGCHSLSYSCEARAWSCVSSAAWVAELTLWLLGRSEVSQRARYMSSNVHRGF